MSKQTTSASLPRRSARTGAFRLLAVPALALACGHEPAGRDGPPISWSFPEAAQAAYERVILVTIDTLRADHLPSYGYPRATAPFIGRLAEKGVLFENALALMPHTAPSHASILTGLPPSLHGVLQNGEVLAAEVPTLAGLFKAAGFETAAFLSVNFLSGIAGGFDHVEAKTQTAQPLIDSVLGWVRGQHGRFFLWIHLYEPHRWKKPEFVSPQALAAVRAGTSVPPAQLYGTLAKLHGLPDPPPGEPFLMPWDEVLPSGEKERAPTREAFVELTDAYDALILQADRELQRLYGALQGLALPGGTLWIVTADHGEGLGSHGYAGHGAQVYNEQIRVPLVFHATDGSLPARRVEALTQHLDLLPTLAELVGADVRTSGAEFLGYSLLPLLRGSGRALPQRFVFAENRRTSEGHPGGVYSLQDATRKLILSGGREQLFRLEDDPLELHGLDPGGPEHAELRARLEDYLQLISRSVGAGSEGPAAEWLQELRDLGYVGEEAR